MKLAHPFFASCFDFAVSPIQVLVLEEPVFYRHLMEELLGQADGLNGQFCLYENGDGIGLEKHIECITDLFCLEPSQNKRLCTAAQKELTDIAAHEMQTELYALYANIHSMLFELIRRSGMDLEFNELNDISGLLKLYDIRPLVPNATLGEKLLLYMELCAKYLKKKLFVVFHLHTLMSQKEIAAFYRDAAYRKLSLLCIETKDVTVAPPVRKVIVDGDMCEI